MHQLMMQGQLHAGMGWPTRRGLEMGAHKVGPIGGRGHEVGPCDGVSTGWGPSKRMTQPRTLDDRIKESDSPE